MTYIITFTIEGIECSTDTIRSQTEMVQTRNRLKSNECAEDVELIEISSTA